MKRLPLILSVVLNVVLIVALVGLPWACRRMGFQAVADAAAAEVRLQEHILAELESGEQARIDKVKEMLRQGIDNGKIVEQDFRSFGK